MIKILTCSIFILLGVFMFIYGECDDSPGAQLLGVLLAVGGSVGVIRGIRKKSN